VDLPLAVEQQVVGLNVAMDHSLLVRVDQRPRRVAGDFAGPPHVLRCGSQLESLRRKVRVLGSGLRCVVARLLLAVVFTVGVLVEALCGNIEADWRGGGLAVEIDMHDGVDPGFAR
jgi:hypothetical protein